MTILHLPNIASQAISALPENAVATFEVAPHAGSALHIKVDGRHASTSICLWQSGLCEITTVMVNSGDATIQEHHLSTEKGAVEYVVAHILEALSLANAEDAPNNSFKPTPLRGAA